MKKLLFVLMLACSVYGANAQQAKQNVAVQEYTEKVDKVVHLQPEQKLRINDALSPFLNRRSYVLEEKNFSDAERKNALMELDKSCEQNLKSILTEEQYAKWTASKENSAKAAKK